MRRRLSQQLVAREPHERWNAFIDLISMEEEKDLTPIQRTAHLAFWYESEVENGGHLQYFLNSAGGRAEAAIPALRALGAAAQADLLEAALKEWSAAERPDEEDEEVDETLGDLDERFSACEPSITELLERYLDQHEAEFIEFVAD